MFRILPHGALFLVLLPNQVEDRLEALFRRGARSYGDPYVLNRERLLEDRAGLARGLSAWHIETAAEQLFADYLRNRLEHPEQTERFDAVLRETYWVDPRAGATGSLRLHGGDVVELNPSIVPSHFDIARELDGRWNSDLLIHFADPRIAEILIGESIERTRNVDALPGVLQACGRDVVPLLQRNLRACPLGPLSSSTPEGREGWQLQRTAVAIANAAGAYPELASELLRHFEQTTSNDLALACARSLTKVRSRASMPELARRLSPWFIDVRARHRRPPPLPYAELRELGLAWGAEFLAVLRESIASASDHLSDEERSFLPTVVDEVTAAWTWEHAHPDAGAANFIDVAELARDRRRDFWRSTVRFDEVPVALQIERAWIVRSLHLAAELLRSSSWPASSAVALLEATPIQRVAREEYESFLAALAARDPSAVRNAVSHTLERDPPPAIAEAAVSAIWPLPGSDVTRILADFGTSLDDLDEPERERWRRVRALIESVLPVARGDVDIATLLEHELAAVRVSAAIELAKRGDARCCSTLFEEMRATRGLDHGRIRIHAVELGSTMVAHLDDRQNDDDLVPRLLARGLLAEIEHPEWAQAIAHATPLARFVSRAGPTARQFRSQGRRLAESLDPEALPLLESTMVFGALGTASDASFRVPSTPTLLFAVAHHGDLRSIELITRLYDGPRLCRDDDLLALALADFGPDGLEAAAAIPPPNPERTGFGSRAGAHRGGALALANAGEPRGAAKMVEALEALLLDPLETDRAEADRLRRARALLREARSMDDPILRDPILRLLGEEWVRRDRRLRTDSFHSLLQTPLGEQVDAARAAAFKSIGLTPHYEVDPAVSLLVRIDGAEVLARIRDEAPTTHSTLAAAANLAIHATSHARRWASERGLDGDHEAIDVFARERVDEAHGLLLSALEGPAPGFAADALVRVAEAAGEPEQPDSRPLSPLLSWMERAEVEISRTVISYVDAFDGPAVEVALVRVLERQGADVAALCRALQERAGPESEEVLLRTLDEAEEEDHWRLLDTPLFRGLSRAGSKGTTRIEAIFARDHRLQRRTRAALVLSEIRPERIEPDAAFELLEEVVERARWHRQLAFHEPDPRRPAHAVHPGAAGGSGPSRRRPDSPRPSRSGSSNNSHPRSALRSSIGLREPPAGAWVTEGTKVPSHAPRPPREAKRLAQLEAWRRSLWLDDDEWILDESTEMLIESGVGGLEALLDLLESPDEPRVLDTAALTHWLTRSEEPATRDRAHTTLALADWEPARLRRARENTRARPARTLPIDRRLVADEPTRWALVPGTPWRIAVHGLPPSRSPLAFRDPPRLRTHAARSIAASRALPCPASDLRGELGAQRGLA